MYSVAVEQELVGVKNSFQHQNKNRRDELCPYPQRRSWRSPQREERRWAKPSARCATETMLERSPPPAESTNQESLELCPITKNKPRCNGPGDRQQHAVLVEERSTLHRYLICSSTRNGDSNNKNAALRNLSAAVGANLSGSTSHTIASTTGGRRLEATGDQHQNGGT